jgi:hypothetical protein
MHCSNGIDERPRQRQSQRQSTTIDRSVEDHGNTVNNALQPVA